MSGQLTEKERSQDESSEDQEYTVLGGMEFDGEMEANENTIIEDKDDLVQSDSKYIKT